MTGSQLIETIVHSTDLPEEPLDRELKSLIKKAGMTPESLTLDQLRSVLADYLQEVLLDAKLDYEKALSEEPAP